MKIKHICLYQRIRETVKILQRSRKEIGQKYNHIHVIYFSKLYTGDGISLRGFHCLSALIICILNVHISGGPYDNLMHV